MTHDKIDERLSCCAPSAACTAPVLLINTSPNTKRLMRFLVGQALGAVRLRFSRIRVLLLYLQTNRLVSINGPNLWYLDAREMILDPLGIALQVWTLSLCPAINRSLSCHFSGFSAAFGSTIKKSPPEDGSPEGFGA